MSKEEAAAFIFKALGRTLDQDEGNLILEYIESHCLVSYAEATGLQGYNSEYVIEGRFYSVCGAYALDEVEVIERAETAYPNEYAAYISRTQLSLPF
jgi:hypothetical protein